MVCRMSIYHRQHTIDDLLLEVRIMMNENLSRRNFIRAASVFSVGMMTAAKTWGQSQDKPNILWVTSEDNGPALGCYGDTFADTPNIDSIAAP